jgi:hypothetical protein
MLWIARHEWPTAFHFVFNCYPHHALLVVHSSSGKRFFLYSKVGVTQGDPLSMILYGLSTLPLIREIKVVYSELFHVWFANDGNAGGHFRILKQFLRWLYRKGHSLGYKLDLGKCVLITSPANLPRAKHCFCTILNPNNIVTGNRVLGSYIGQPANLDTWLSSKTQHWVEQIQSLSLACPQFPQSAYCAMQKSLQIEWQFVQRITKCPPDSLLPLKLPLLTLFFQLSSNAHPHHGTSLPCLSNLLVFPSLIPPKQPNPTFPPAALSSAISPTACKASVPLIFSPIRKPFGTKKLHKPPMPNGTKKLHKPPMQCSCRPTSSTILLPFNEPSRGLP